MPSHQNVRSILVIPYPAPGHMLSLLDLTQQLLRQGLAVTVLVTTGNLSILDPLLSANPDSVVETLVFPFPSHPSIPTGVENMQHLPIHFLPHILSSLAELRHPLLAWLRRHPSPPAAIISFIFLSFWTYTLAKSFGIKRIGFSPTNVHTLCAWWRDAEKKDRADVANFVIESHVANMASWGLIVNSFIELDGPYIDQLKTKFMGHDRVWPVA